MSVNKEVASIVLSSFDKASLDHFYDDDYSLPIKKNVDLSNGENPLEAPEGSPEAIAKYFGVLSKYPEKNCHSLVAALADFHKLPKQNFVVTPGSNGALMASVATFVQKGDNIVMPTLSFPIPAMEAKVRGGNAIRIRMRDDVQVDLTGLENGITNQTKMVYLCNPNNPTGLYLPPEQIADFAKRVNIPVVVSEANVEYVGRSLMDIKDLPENIIVARSFSKAYGLAGLRVGYAYTAKYAEKLLQCFSPNMVSILSVGAAINALSDQEKLKRSVDYMASERVYVSGKLKALGFGVLESQANNLLTVLPNDIVSSTALVAALFKKDCSVVDGATFPGLNNDRCIRVVPGKRPLNNEFLICLKEILETDKSIRPSGFAGKTYDFGKIEVK